MKKKIACLVLAAVLAFAVPARALAFGFAVPFAIEDIVIMLLGLCGITVSDDFDVDQFIEDVQEQLDEAGSNLTLVSYLSGIAASKVLNTVAIDYAEVLSAVLSIGNEQATITNTDFVGSCPRVVNGALYYTSGSNKYYTWGGMQSSSGVSSAPASCDIYFARISNSSANGLCFFARTSDLGNYNYMTYRRFNSTRYDGVAVYSTSGDYTFSNILTFAGNIQYVDYYYNSLNINVPTYASIQDLQNALQNIDNGGAVSVSDDVINGNATDIDYNTVNDRGVLTGQKVIDLGAIADAFGSIADAWAGVRENVRSWADVVSAGRVIPSVDDKVIEDTATNESVISDTSVADAAANIGDVGDYNLGLENFFPFCLPWDLYNFVTLLEATPEAPVIEWEFPVDVEGNTEHMEWSLEDLEPLAEILRTFLTLAFAVGLIFAGGKLFKH